jgi:hypothetical protein
MANIPFSSSSVSLFGGAFSDLFAVPIDPRRRATGSKRRTMTLPRRWPTRTRSSPRPRRRKQQQFDRNIYQTIGGQQADIAGAGFANSGSSLDLLRDSASQGALTKAVAGQQGLITEAGYKEQAESYTNLASAARMAADAEDNAAKGSTITGIIKGAAGVASLFAGGGITSLLGGGDSGGFTPEAPSDGNPLVINRYGTPGPASSSPGNPATPLGAIY